MANMSINFFFFKQKTAYEIEMKDLQKHLFELRTQAVTEKLEDPSLLRKTRKDIARFKTILRQRQLEAETAKRPLKDTKAQKQDKEAAKPRKATAKVKSRGRANVK